MTLLQKYVSVLKVAFYFINIILSASTVKKHMGSKVQGQ